MSTFHLSNRHAPDDTLTLPEFLDLFRPEMLDAIELGARGMREEFRVTSEVPDHQAFHDELFRFHAHVERWRWGIVRDPATLRESWYQNTAWEQLRRWYRGRLRDAEDNAVLQRDRGMIGVIDDLVTGVLQQEINSYIDGKFADYLPEHPVEWQRCQQLAIAILEHHRDALLGQEYDPGFAAAMLASRIPQALKTTIMHARSRQSRQSPLERKE